MSSGIPGNVAAPAPANTTGDPQPVKKLVGLYEGSSQYRHWRFSPEQLTATRRNLNAAAVKAIKDAFETDSPGSSSSISFLNADDEYALVKLYVEKIPQICRHFHFSEEVEATAVTYLKRFYLKNTVMDWHPRNVMLTALFLAAKTTNNPIPIEDYSSNLPKTAPADVLDLEFLVAQSLGFEFSVWHAHRALWGLRLDLQTLPEASEEKIEVLCDDALKYVRASRLTDAEFIYTPSQIALASLAFASPALAQKWAVSKGQGLQASQLLPRIQELITAEGEGPEVEFVKQVDKRLRICKNPEKVKGSKAWLKKQKDAEEAAKEKRMRKAEETRKAMESEDPFGGHLIGEMKVDGSVQVVGDGEMPIDDDDDDDD